jgi:hypothetical protein
MYTVKFGHIDLATLNEGDLITLSTAESSKGRQVKWKNAFIGCVVATIGSNVSMEKKQDKF